LAEPCEHCRVEILERESELSALLAAVDAAEAGRGALVLVAGEAGIGKTTLVHLLRDQVRDRARMVVVGCEPLSVPEPLGPFRDLGGAFEALDAVLATADAPRLARALCASCSGLTIVAIEDVHWADALTLDVVRLLARRVGETQLLVVVTYRDDELAVGDPVGMLVGDLASSRVLRIKPGRLSSDAVAALAESSERDASGVFELTAGNPFLVVELLEQTGDEPPATVREAALARAARLSVPARLALDAAAVIGGRVPLALLNAVSESPSAAVEECLACGILIDDGRALAFRHELIRRAVEVSMPVTRRELLNGRVADALESAPPPLDHGRIAHHASLAGRGDAVLLHAPLAAERALRLGALCEAAALYDLALAHAGAVPAERAALLTASGSANWMSGRNLAAASAALEEAAAIGAELGDVVVRGRALRSLARTYWLMGRFDEAAGVADEAIALLAEAGDDRELALALAWKTGLLALLHDCAGVRALAPRAYAAASKAGVEEAAIALDISVALVAGMGGDRTAPDAFKRALARARRCGAVEQQVRALVNGTVVAALLRDHGCVETLYTEAVELFEEQGLDSPLDDVTQSRGKSLLDRGLLREAAAAGRAAQRVATVESALSRALEATALARLGEPGARVLAEAALDEVVGAPDGYREAVARSACAEIEWLSGDHAAGRTHARAGLALPACAGIPSLSGELVLWAYRCGVPKGELPALGGPVALELRGEWQAASALWRSLDAPYEAALAALPADSGAAAAAVAELQRLEAHGAVAAFARERRAAGLSVPRGRRARTRTDPAGLTAREREVLALVAEGRTNGEIAGALVLSEKTVGHHVSALLRKLDAHTRTEAVVNAARFASKDRASETAT
jgi:DNA-binding CsgD family transcriptional regulator/tetratricopeptide (TPR) repeat protein